MIQWVGKIAGIRDRCKITKARPLARGANSTLKLRKAMPNPQGPIQLANSRSIP